MFQIISRTLTTAAAVTLLTSALAPAAMAQGTLANATGLRCSFPLTATGSWKKDDATAAVQKASLVLLFDTIDADDGTARLKTGSVGNEVVVQAAGGYLHLIQTFRTGPLYTTTVFDQATMRGTFKAVHSRHELFATPLPGATSSPEQYYGECTIVSQRSASADAARP